MDNVKIVQQRLWSNGHRTKRIPVGIGFDLIVDGKVRVRVFNMTDKPHTFSGFDMLAFVENDRDGSKKVFFTKDRKNYSKNINDIIGKGGVMGK